MKIPSGKRPACATISLDQWKDRISEVPIPIREICITGGEPTLSPIFVDLVKWLLEKGYHVLVYSNLANYKRFLEIPKSYRFSIVASFHHEDDIIRFTQAYKEIYKKHRIDVDEIDCGLLSFSRVKKMIGKSEMIKDNHSFVFRPDGSIEIGCYNAYL